MNPAIEQFKLNTIDETNPTPKYKFFGGQLETTMPQLLIEGYRPISIHELFKRQLEVMNIAHQEPEEFKKTWQKLFVSGSNIIMGDGIYFHPDEKVKLVLDAPNIRNLPQEIELYRKNIHIHFLSQQAKKNIILQMD